MNYWITSEGRGVYTFWRNEIICILLQKFSCMGCFFSFKWIFLIVGYRVAAWRGAFIGFLFGFLLDSMISRRTITFRFYTNTDQQQWGRGYSNPQPYVNEELYEAYRTLGINENASDEEVRQAYRQLALRYHPDRVSSQGEQARLEAEKKFQAINRAKEIVFKERGLK